MKKVTLIKGDGIGPEVVDSALRVLEAAGAEIQWEERLAGLSAIDRGEDILPESTSNHSGKRGWLSRDR